MTYRKISKHDCLSVATDAEKDRLLYIWDYQLLKGLAIKWCKANGYVLGGYSGQGNWDATTGEQL